MKRKFSPNERSTQKSKENLPIFEIFNHPARLEILMILQMYPALNVTQIANLTSYSKSTIARHLLELENHGILISEQLPTTIEGRFDPKIYRIKSDKSITLNTEGFDPIEASLSENIMFLSLLQLSTASFIQILKKLFSFYQKISSDYDESSLQEIIKKELPNTDPEFRFLFFDKTHFNKLCTLREKFRQDIDKLLEEQSSQQDNGSFPYLYFEGAINLKKIFDFEKKYKKKNK